MKLESIDSELPAARLCKHNWSVRSVLCAVFAFIFFLCCNYLHLFSQHLVIFYFSFFCSSISFTFCCAILIWSIVFIRLSSGNVYICCVTRSYIYSNWELRRIQTYFFKYDQKKLLNRIENLWDDLFIVRKCLNYNSTKSVGVLYIKWLSSLHSGDGNGRWIFKKKRILLSIYSDRADAMLLQPTS